MLSWRSIGSGVIAFNQYGFSFSVIKNLMDDFYISFDHEYKIKDISDGGDTYNNSYSFLRLGYQF